MRLLRMIRRELDVAMRARIHTTLLRTIMGVEGALESATEATEIQTELQANPDTPTARREHFDARLVERLRQCDNGLDFLVEASEQAGRLTKLCGVLDYVE